MSTAKIRLPEQTDLVLSTDGFRREAYVLLLHRHDVKSYHLVSTTDSVRLLSSIRYTNKETSTRASIYIRIYLCNAAIGISSSTDSWDGRDHFDQLKLVQYRGRQATSRLTMRMLISLVLKRRFNTREKANPVLLTCSRGGFTSEYGHLLLPEFSK